MAFLPYITIRVKKDISRKKRIYHSDEWMCINESEEGKSDILQKNKIASKISHHTKSYINSFSYFCKKPYQR